jgi:lipoate-protein ligase A
LLRVYVQTIFGEHEVEEYHLTEEDWNNIKQLSNEKYRTWDWNFSNFSSRSKLYLGFLP